MMYTRRAVAGKDGMSSSASCVAYMRAPLGLAIATATASGRMLQYGPSVDMKWAVAPESKILGLDGGPELEGLRCVLSLLVGTTSLLDTGSRLDQVGGLRRKAGVLMSLQPPFGARRVAVGSCLSLRFLQVALVWLGLGLRPCVQQ